MGRIIQRNWLEKQDAYDEYISIIDRFKRDRNYNALSRNLYLWGDRWKTPKKDLYHYHKKMFRGLT